VYWRERREREKEEETERGWEEGAMEREVVYKLV